MALLIKFFKFWLILQNTIQFYSWYVGEHRKMHGALFTFDFRDIASIVVSLFIWYISLWNIYMYLFSVQRRKLALSFSLKNIITLIWERWTNSLKITNLALLPTELRRQLKNVLSFIFLFCTINYSLLLKFMWILKSWTTLTNSACATSKYAKTPSIFIFIKHPQAIPPLLLKIMLK